MQLLRFDIDVLVHQNQICAAVNQRSLADQGVARCGQCHRKKIAEKTFTATRFEQMTEALLVTRWNDVLNGPLHVFMQLDASHLNSHLMTRLQAET